MENEKKFTFKLVQKAKNKGGDKYVCTDDETFVIYFPQTVSRTVGTEPREFIIITSQT